jgi:hypothetical protein
MADTLTYIDLGAVQRPESGSSGGANYTYIDLGAAQRQEAAAGGGMTIPIAMHHIKMIRRQ